MAVPVAAAAAVAGEAAGAEAAATGTSRLAGVFGQFTTESGNLQKAMMRTRTDMGLLRYTFHNLTHPIQTITKSFSTLKDSILDSVKAFRPFTIVMFNRALLDLKATFGVILAPIVESVTRIIRSFADAIYNIPKPIQELIGGFVRLIAALSGTVALGAIVATTIAGITALVGAIGLMASGLAVFGPLILTVSAAIAIISAPFIAFGAVIIAVSSAAIYLVRLFAQTEGGMKAINAVWKGFQQVLAFVGATFDKLMTRIKPVTDALKTALSELGDSLADLFTALKPILAAGLVPIIAIVVSGIAAVAKALTLLAQGIKFFLDMVKNHPLVRMMTAIGGKMEGKEGKASSYGLGWGSSQVSTGPTEVYNRITEELLRNTRLNGEQPKMDPNEQTAKQVNKFGPLLMQALMKYLGEEGKDILPGVARGVLAFN